MSGSTVLAVVSHQDLPPPRNSPSSITDEVSNDGSKHHRGVQPIDEGESEGERIERIGRQRPKVFKSLWAEIGFCYSIVASELMCVSSLSIKSRREMKYLLSGMLIR